MEKFTRLAPRVRVLLALPALATIPLLAACGDDDPAWPSTAPVESVMIQKVPQGAPSLIIETYGDSLRLLGVPVDAGGTFVDAPVSWASSRPGLADVATHVGADGRTYGVLKFAANPSYANPTNVDTVTITATAGGQSGTIRVIVREDPRVETVGVTAITPFLIVGDTRTVTATARDGFGNAIPAPNPWQWATSSASVATVTDLGDGTATITVTGQGAASVTASVLNAGEPAATGTITGATSVVVPQLLTSGQAIAVATISDGGVRPYTINVPAGATSLVVQIFGATSGDADLYVFAPNTIPNHPTMGTNFVCRPFLIGSNETCTIANPTAGVWGIRINAFEGDGDMAGLTLVATVN
jgi:hypothetical protein